jgi:hypothetical protein
MTTPCAGRGTRDILPLSGRWDHAKQAREDVIIQIGIIT